MSNTESVPQSAGAIFRRADLHVHTHSDSDAPRPDLPKYIKAAENSGIEILAITDHNSAAYARAAVEAAQGSAVMVVPGVEISTRDGHLLALFDPDRLEDLESFATADNLKLKKLSAAEQRSERGILDLVDEIGAKGGLAIPAHVDTPKGICKNLRQSELSDLLSKPALAGLEFVKSENLSTWFTDEDDDNDRRAAWKARQRVRLLKDRGLVE